MIERLVGTVVERSEEHVLVDVGGVGYGVEISTATAARLPPPGGEARLVVRTLFPRGEAIVLYGFAAPDEADLFDRLRAISGLGPALALRLLGIPVGRLREAIRTRDVKLLQEAPGVGARIARRIITELAEALPDPETPAEKPEVLPADPERDLLVNAFLQLQFSERRRIEEAIDAVRADAPDASSEEHFKAALARLRGAR